VQDPRIATHGEQRRRVVDLAEQARVAGLAMGDEMGAEGGDAVQFGFGLMPPAAAALAPVGGRRQAR